MKGVREREREGERERERERKREREREKKREISTFLVPVPKVVQKAESLTRAPPAS